jgi:hypothetical protein
MGWRGASMVGKFQFFGRFLGEEIIEGELGM